MREIKDKSILAIVKCTQTIYFDYIVSYNPKDMYPFYELNIDYEIIAKVGQLFEIRYDEELEQYVAQTISRARGTRYNSIQFENAKELRDFEGFEIIKFYDKELERLCLKQKKVKK